MLRSSHFLHHYQPKHFLALRCEPSPCRFVSIGLLLANWKLFFQAMVFLTDLASWTSCSTSFDMPGHQATILKAFSFACLLGCVLWVSSIIWLLNLSGMKSTTPPVDDFFSYGQFFRFLLEVWFSFWTLSPITALYSFGNIFKRSNRFEVAFDVNQLGFLRVFEEDVDLKEIDFLLFWCLVIETQSA